MAINTAAVRNPELISEVASNMVINVWFYQLKLKRSSNSWEIYTECGRESTGIEVTEWAKKAELLGAGEILLTSIDCEGTRKGFDLDLMKLILEAQSQLLQVEVWKY